jgi:Glutaminase
VVAVPRRNAHVGEIRALGSPGPPAEAGRRLPVTFSDGRQAWLDLADARSEGWLAALDGMRAAGLVAYAELDPETSVIVELRRPLAVTVGELRETADGVDVELVISHARHVLRRDSPDFDELRGALEQAREGGTGVLVTETDAHEIIDVRPDPKGVRRLAAPEPGRAGAEGEGVTGTLVSLAQAQQMFNLVNTRTCCSAAPSAPCIPFTYPDDGCWGRAHEMCRLIIAQGIQPDKVWIYGGLHVSSANKPDCTVLWNWHVAPTLAVSTASGTQTYVIDPSLFPGPVTQATWAGVQGDPAATLVPTGADVYYRSFGGSISYDPNYVDTNAVLADYRIQLQLRSASAVGPPPYLACRPNPAGVQWQGTLEPGVTRRWYTYNWPASWHVVWTVMPITICAGAPQVSWSVAVERANATYCTYWITVTNLTSRTVRFEGRYNILST